MQALAIEDEGSQHTCKRFHLRADVEDGDVIAAAPWVEADVIAVAADVEEADVIAAAQWVEEADVIAAAPWVEADVIALAADVEEAVIAAAPWVEADVIAVAPFVVADKTNGSNREERHVFEHWTLSTTQQKLKTFT